MKYTATSIKAALERVRESKGFSYKGLDGLICPNMEFLMEDPLGGLTMRECSNLPPNECPYARGRFGGQHCKHEICIYNNRGVTRKYQPLFFYFTISDKSREGFIDKDDNLLGKLIDNGDIRAEDLEEVE